MNSFKSKLILERIPLLQNHVYNFSQSSLTTPDMSKYRVEVAQVHRS